MKYTQVLTADFSKFSPYLQSRPQIPFQHPHCPFTLLKALLILLIPKEHPTWAQTKMVSQPLLLMLHYRKKLTVYLKVQFLPDTESLKCFLKTTKAQARHTLSKSEHIHTKSRDLYFNILPRGPFLILQFEDHGTYPYNTYN